MGPSGSGRDALWSHNSGLQRAGRKKPRKDTDNFILHLRNLLQYLFADSEAESRFTILIC